MVVLGAPPFSLRLSAGDVPILVFGTERASPGAIALNVYNTVDAGADVTVVPWQVGERVEIGGLFGYRYNGVLGHAAGVGGAVDYDISRVLAVAFSVELLAFPQATDRLARAGYPADRDPVVPWLQGGANVALLFYP
jgi:hypothetical protein